MSSQMGSVVEPILARWSALSLSLTPAWPGQWTQMIFSVSPCHSEVETPEASGRRRACLSVQMMLRGGTRNNLPRQV